MSRRRAFAAVALAAAGLALAGCSAMLPRLMPPRLSISAVSLRGGSLARQRVQLQIHVSNPNDRAISVRSIDVNVDLAGQPFATGVSAAPILLPARGDTDFALDVTANAANALVVLAGSLGRRSVAYHLYGELHLEHSLVRTIHFTHDGRVRL
ncbi:MAG TPA: LEA type 2 family protein [Steroidobacteraceae bacterium]|nr:LEA type 2 family protein [Steroidobacteraceae bacterium]